MVAAKPDCTGQRFGLLTVLGKGEIVKTPCKTRGNRSRRLWDLQCDCGNKVSLPRGDFDRPSGGQRSCGCLYRDRKGKPHKNAKNFTGMRFGSLSVVERVGTAKNGKPLWSCDCDCGVSGVLIDSNRFRTGYRLNCGDRTKHLWGLWYPPAPSPYPAEASDIVIKHLGRTKTSATRLDSAIQDEIMNRLLRAAWIVTYRRQQGEDISELKEKRYINKWLRYSHAQVRLRRKLERDGGLTYTVDGKIRKIGGVMTNSTSQNEPVIETQAVNCMSTFQKPRKIRFLRR